MLVELPHMRNLRRAVHYPIWPRRVQATHWSQISASEASTLTRASTYHSAGTILAVIRPTAIGSVAGGIMDLRATGAVWLGILPGTPDYLRLSINIGGTLRNADVPYTPGDAALYSGGALFAWGKWASSTQGRAGWGRTDSGLTTTATVSGVLVGAACDVTLGGLGSASRSLAGEFECAYFDRALSDAEINVFADALSLAGAAGDAFVYPVPALGMSPGDVISLPGAQVADAGTDAGVWSISTVDGTSPIQVA